MKIDQVEEVACAMKNFARKPELTADGTYTLYIPEIDEHYHSVNGAQTEANHVYIQAAFLHRNLSQLSVLEVGFGTGLNAFLTLLKVLKEGYTVYYTTLELYPLDYETILQLNYPTLIAPEYAELYFAMHRAPWNTPVEIVPGFTIEKRMSDLTSCELHGAFDVVYFDAFAPDKQPEMWSEEIYQKIYNQMNPKALLTTYCAKGVVRRGFQSTGLQMERIPGPPGKREMLRASKQ